MNAQYTPQEAHGMENALLVLWKPSPGAGKVPPVSNKSGTAQHIRDIAEAKRKQVLSVLSNEWVNATEVSRMFEHHPDNIRSTITLMAKQGRIEERKHKNRIQIRLPQEVTS